MKYLIGQAFYVQLIATPFTSPTNGKTESSVGDIIVIGAMNVKTFGFSPERKSTVANGSFTYSSC